MNKWISTKDSLPEPGKYVIAKHNKKTWNDSTDQENVNTVVVKLVLGLSMESREQLKQEVFIQFGEPKWLVLRTDVYRPEDEHGNNQVAYNWQAFGIDSYFGQQISHWMTIPDININQNQ